MKCKVTLLCFALLLINSSGVLFAQNTSGDNLTLTLESFDVGSRTREWKVEGSRFAGEGYPRMAYAKVFPKAMQNVVEDESAQRVLGVNSHFDQIGYNYFEIIPIDKTTKEYSPIPFEGVIKTLEMWVWGANYSYTLEASLMDYNGIVYRLPICDLEFVGWQYKKVNIPHTIPQMVRQIPHDRPLKLTKFIVSTSKQERVDNFYVYLDLVRYSTHRIHDQFDGDNLIEPETIDQIWGDDNK